MSPEATEAPEEVKVQLGLWALGGHLLRAVLVAVEHCAAELAAGLRERSAMEPSRGHRERVPAERQRPARARGFEPSGVQS